MKIISVVGARPQFIKLAPLSRAIRKNYEEIIVHTGQHYDKEMSKLFFNELEIPQPNYNLNINGGNHGEQTGKMLIEIEKILLNERPDVVIVFGDTNSTLAGSLAASKIGIKCIHIEAGLRSFNKTMPEEINRIVCDHLSDFLFAPTNTAIKNLVNEGLTDKSFLTGDIMVDSLQYALSHINGNNDILINLGVKQGDYYLLTLHRPYNVDDPVHLGLILNKLKCLNKKILFPIHPRTRKVMDAHNIITDNNVILCAPQSYLDFISLEVNSKKIITDSGGIQKESYILQRPCITIRPETEWIETVTEGWNHLADINDDSFIDKVLNFNPQHSQNNIFGNNVAMKMTTQINKILERIS